MNDSLNHREELLDLKSPYGYSFWPPCLLCLSIDLKVDLKVL